MIDQECELALNAHQSCSVRVLINKLNLYNFAKSHADLWCVCIYVCVCAVNSSVFLLRPLLLLLLTHSLSDGM